MKGLRAARALLVSASVLCVIPTTGCMPLFPRPNPPSPFLTRPLIRELVRCEETINRYGRRLVNTQHTSIEDCAQDILDVSFLFDNEIIDEEEYFDAIDRIRNKCDRGLDRIERASTRFVDRVIDACDPVQEYILDYDLLRFQLLSEETDGTVNIGSLPLLAGSLCGIKSLFAMQLMLFQIPRVMELYSYLGDEYIEITDDNDFPIGRLVLRLDERCIVPES
jgi:hypothetical protein